jgi:hypothetical protein
MMKWVKIVWSSGLLQHAVLWMYTDVSEKLSVFILRKCQYKTKKLHCVTTQNTTILKYTNKTTNLGVSILTESTSKIRVKVKY